MNELPENVTQSTFPTQRGAYTLIPDEYTIVVEGEEADGDYLTLIMGFTHKKWFSYTHPNLARSEMKTFEFKHSNASGHKWWTSDEGVEHTFIVPRSQVHMVRENGYSYPKLWINGQYVQLNTSGGGGGKIKGWVDWIYPDGASTTVNHPKEVVEAVAEVAVRKPEPEPAQPEPVATTAAGQVVMFAKGEDLPLMSGTPQTVHENAFNPAPIQAQQLKMF